MKTVIVLLMMGNVVGTWDIGTTDMDWCVGHAAKFMEIAHLNALEDKNFVVHGQEVRVEDLQIGCIQLQGDERPKLGESFDVNRLKLPG